MKQFFTYLLSCLLLIGCSSSPTPLNYYLLHDPLVASHSPETGKALMWESISLPDYLQQPNLSTLRSGTELNYATQHFWAEPVSSGIRQSLEDNLSVHHQRSLVPYNTEQPMLRLVLVIEDFVPTFEGDVILRGHFTLHDGAGVHHPKSFFLRKGLERDGYAGAVMAMRNTLIQLADVIEKELETLTVR